MEVKEWVLDRIEYSFTIFKNNFLSLFLPLFIYKLVWFIFSTAFLYFFAINIIIWLFTKVKIDVFDFFTLLSNPNIILLIFISVLSFLVYLILYIPFLLSIIKTVKDIVNWEKYDIFKNIEYWFKNIFKSFNIYWYIFVYIALIPCLLIIIWGLFFNLWYYSETDVFYTIWAILLWIWWLSLMILSIYRWLKTSFSIHYSVNQDNYEKNIFLKSIDITNNKWWRIAWNFILLSIIISLLLSLLSSTISIFWNWNTFNLTYNNLKDIEQIINFFEKYNFASQIPFGLINLIINSVVTTFTIIFTYIFFLRLRYESENHIPEKIYYDKGIKQNEL